MAETDTLTTDLVPGRGLVVNGTWQVLRQLRGAADHGPIGHYRQQTARDRLRQAAAWLRDLERDGNNLATCGQGDLDQWFANANTHQRNAVRAFLGWAIRTRATARLQVPPTIQPGPSPISRQQRIQLIRRLHDGDGMDLTERVIGLLILLYAQSLPRIVRLTVDDITTSPDDGNDADHQREGQAGMFIRLGNPPAPVPAPFDQVIADYLAARPNLTTATNPGSRWLFPGRRAGQPLHPTSIRLRLQRLGIPNLNSRSRALREMLLAAPPSVVAAMIGYAPARAEAIAAQAGGTWKQYAAGDHTRPDIATGRVEG